MIRSFAIKKYGLGQKLFVYILLFSSLVTLIGTSVQLYADYSKDRDLLYERMNQIETSYLEALTDTMWISNIKLLKSQLNGILQLPDIEYLDIEQNGHIVIKVGTLPTKNVISRKLQLLYKYKNREMRLGTLNVVASFEGVYQRTMERIFIILVTQGIKTFLVSAFIFFIFYILVGRHLIALAAYARSMDMKRLDAPFRLDRSPHAEGKEDELDVLESSINEMRVNLNSSYTEMRKEVLERTLAEESLRQYEHIVSSSTDMMALLDKELVFLAVNTAYAKAFGKSNHELVGYSVSKIFGSRFVDKTIKPSAMLCFEGKKVNHTAWVDFPATGRKYMDVHYYPYIGVDNEVKGFVVNARDITQNKKAEEAIIAAKEEAERSNKAKSIFLSSISHEIRTPLTSIMGFSGLLISDKKEPLKESQNELLTKIVESGEQLLGLVNDILDLSKIESGKIESSPYNVDISYVAITAVVSLAAFAENHDVKLSVNNSSEDCYVYTDDNHLLQIILNFVSNAIKYNRPGGEVVISWRLSGKKRVRMSVSDTGYGIPENQFANMFKPFDRLGVEGGNIKGSGIGLTIVKRLAESMDSEVGVESEVGKGSTFYIDIPLGNKPESGLVKNVTDRPEPPSLDKRRAGRVLYIEDNKFNVELVTRMLADWPNVTLSSRENAEEGIEVARAEKPDMILMDIGLPGISGIEALKRLKQFEETVDIPVVAISARAMKHEIEEGISAGFDDYITKPIGKNQLYQTLNKHLAPN